MSRTFNYDILMNRKYQSMFSYVPSAKPARLSLIACPDFDDDLKPLNTTKEELKKEKLYNHNNEATILIAKC